VSTDRATRFDAGHAARSRLIRRATATLVLLGELAACVPHPVGPARTYEKYEGKGVTTAEGALSAVATVGLAAAAASKGKTLGRYTAVLTSEQEDALAGVQGTFNSIQPPDDRADRLRDQLDGILTPALAHVSAVRIAAHRGQLDQLATVAAPLDGDAQALQAFIAAHQ
jgi:hypothetical protein